jgi:hypothetical protein
LRNKYGNENVTSEHPDFAGGRIDIVVNNNNEYIFYEIKTYTSLKASIREAIGQLMEYALWPNGKRAKELIVVTQMQCDIEDAKVYFAHLRDMYGLSLYYQWYDFEKRILSEKY